MALLVLVVLGFCGVQGQEVVGNLSTFKEEIISELDKGNSVTDAQIIRTVPANITDKLYLLLYKGPTANDWVQIPYKDGFNITKYSFFDVNRTSVFHFHGFGEFPDDTIGSIWQLASAFLQYNKTNFIALDYTQFIRYGGNPFLYVPSFFNNSFIAEAFAGYFKNYINDIQPMKLIHFTSFSMGSQILHRLTKYILPLKPQRITALDPAGPIYDLPGVDHLSYEDADFVDVIHSDGGVVGDYRTLGHVDFFPNSGRRMQPGCEDQFTECSHARAIKFYAESVNNPTAFPAKMCQRNVACDLGLSFCPCTDNATVYMGYHVNTTARGTYYLKTNGTSPYGLGKEGLSFP